MLISFSLLIFITFLLILAWIDTNTHAPPLHVIDSPCYRLPDEYSSPQRLTPAWKSQ